MMKKNHPNSKRVLALFLSVLMLCMQLPMGVFAVDASTGVSTGVVEAPTEEPTGELSLGSSVFVEEKTLFSFTPTSDGVYCFYSEAGEGADPFAYLLDSDKIRLIYDDDSGEGMNFELHYAMTGGTTYYVEAGAYNKRFPYTLFVEESDLESIEIVSIPEFEVIEGDMRYGNFANTYNDEIVDRYFEYNVYQSVSKAVIKVNYKDGTSEELSYYNEETYDYNGISYEWDFYQNPWTVGSDNHYYVTYKGLKALADATVLETPVEKIEVASLDLPEFIENDFATGYWSRYYEMLELDEEYFCYRIEQYADSVVLLVTYKDGTTEEVPAYTEDGHYNGIRVVADQYQNPWTLGENEFEIWYQGVCITETATVVESQVESIRISSGGTYEYTEGDTNCGWWDGDQFLFEAYPFMQDIVLEVTYKDGSVREVFYGKDPGVTFTHNQYEKPWTVGGENEITISYQGKELVAYVTVKPSIVESFTVDNVVVTEGTGGSFWGYNTEEGYDTWYHYEIFPGNITVNLIDGTKFSGTSDEVFEKFGTNVSFSPENYQDYYNQWGVGEYKITASFLGKKAEFYFIIEESDVASIFVEDVEMREGQDGFWQLGYWEAGEWIEDLWFQYDVWNQEFTVTFKDGTVFQGTPYQFEEAYGIDAHFSYDQSHSNQWKPGETHKTKLFICGKTAEFSATIVEKEVESIEVIDTQGFVFYENDTNYGSMQGSYFHYNAYNLVNKVTLLVTYKDGTTKEVPYFDPTTGEYAYFNFSESQNKKPWTVGGENKLVISYLGAATTISAPVVNSPILSVEAEDLTIIRYTGGFWNNDGYHNELGIWTPNNFYYHYREESPKITITYRDGQVISGTSDEIAEKTGNRPSFSSLQDYENQWGLGEHTANVTFMGTTAEYTVSIVESNVASIEVADMSVIEGTGGWWTTAPTSDNVPYHYYYYQTTPSLITIHYTDGTSITGTMSEIEEKTGFRPETKADQSGGNPWGVGSHTVTLTYYGASTTYQFTVEPSPIASISAEPITFTRFTGGHWNGYHDEEGYKEYYYYSVDPAKVTVTYTDGTSFTGTPDEIFRKTGYSVTTVTDQDYQNQWGVGTYTAKVSFMGKECDLTVTIAESNIESITVPDVTMLEGTNGWWTQYYDSENVLRRYYTYEIIPEEITVNYKDGTPSLTGTLDEIEAQTGSRPQLFSDQSRENLWGVGTHKVEISYAGITSEYNVVIEASNVASVTAKPLTYVENAGGWWNTHFDEFGNEHQYYSYSTTPSEITITYTDGSTLSGTPDYIQRETGYRVYYFNDQNYYNQWGVGSHTVMLSFLGRTGEMIVNVEASPVESITVDTVYIEEGTNGYWSGIYGGGYYFTYRTEPENITIFYKDGTSVSGTYSELREKLNYQISCSNQQNSENQWDVGTHRAKLSYMGVSAEFDVVITPTQIADIKIMPIIYAAGKDGWTNSEYYDEELGYWVDGEWYEYNDEPKLMEVTFKNGTVFAGEFESFLALGYDFRIENDQSYFTPWNTGVHSSVVFGPGVRASYTIEVVDLIEKESFSYGVLSDGTAALFKYVNVDEDVILPETVDGYTVSVIENNVLYYADSRSVTIPASVKWIGYDAFSWNHNLTTVKIHAGLEAIGTRAFYNCSELTEVIFYGTYEEAESLLIYNRNDSLTAAEWKYTAECSEHEYDSVCDAECNICFASREPEHAYEWVIDYEGNCVEDGSKHERCTLCGASRNYGTKIPAKGEHENTEWLNQYDATCGNWGYTGDLYCKDCDTYLEYGKEIEPTGEHENTEWINRSEATCGNPGNTGDLYCKDCENIVEEGEDIPATGDHKHTEWINKSDATCGTTGYTGDLYCYDCNMYVENGEIIPVTGTHGALSVIGAKVATCNEEGYTGDVFCKVCKTVTSHGEIIPATGKHVYDNAYDTTCNTCGEERESAATAAVLSMTGGTYLQGETIRIDVSIKGNTGFAGLQFGILYDNTYLTLKDVETQMEDFFVTVGNSIVFDSVQNHTSDGVIATLVFEIAKDANVGDYGLQLRFMSASNDGFEAVVMTDCATTITVESAVEGDANGDGFVDTIDLVMLRKYLASMDPVTKISEIEVRKGADANSDGVIDAIDLAFVRQYLASMSAF